MLLFKYKYISVVSIIRLERRAVNFLARPARVDAGAQSRRDVMSNVSR